jgi:hypothetical protein
MLHDPFRSLGKFLSDLFGELSRIAEILVVHVDVLRNDGLDPATDTVGGLAFFDPDRREQFEYVARLDFGDGELADSPIGVALE